MLPVHHHDILRDLVCESICGRSSLPVHWTMVLLGHGMSGTTEDGLCS